MVYRLVGRGLYEVYVLRDGKHELVAKMNGSLASVQDFIRRKTLGVSR